MIENEKMNRLPGLDTLRATAIVLVLMYHYMVVISGKNTFGLMTEIGWVGVDLFFVLSGYLIGNQLIAPIAQGGSISLRSFYAKRALRTLPNYYFILAIYFLFPLQLAGPQTASLWRFLSFTQNIGLHPGQTFTHSWSLCIEEQFYLVLPLAVLLIAAFKGRTTLGWSVLGAGMIVGMLVRGLAWYGNGKNAMSGVDYYEHIYYSSFARFDELLPGVAIAMLKNLHPRQFSKLMEKGNALFAGGLLATVASLYLFLNFHEIPNDGFGFFMSTFGYTLLASSFALLTLSALSTNSVLHKLPVPGAARLSLWSYAIYLAHKPIFKLLISPMQTLGIDSGSVPGVAIVMLTSVAGGWLLFRLVETPFMRLRARMYPAKGSGHGAGSGWGGVGARVKS